MQESTLAAGGFEFVMENREEAKDGGPSLRVYGSVDGARVQLLRFDMFRVQPHYHYDPAARNLRYDLDPLTIDDGIGWVVSLIEKKLPQLLEKTGYEGIATPAGVGAVTAVLPEIEQRWRGVVPASGRPG